MCMYTWGVRKFKQHKMIQEKEKNICVLFELFTRVFCIVLLVFICIIKDEVIRADEKYEFLFIILILAPFTRFMFLEKPLLWSVYKK